ncbi:MAG: formyltransferase family protein [Candidatus Ozemobacteraceae bacterium]
MKTIRAIYVTSSVTYVKDNYRCLVESLCNPSTRPHGVEGAALVLLRIPPAYVLKNGFGLIALGAPDVGFALLRNLLSSYSHDPRVAAAERAGMKVFRCNNVNRDEALSFFRSLDPDLIVNMRTRNIYKAPILGLPKIGCINIHHGLLPDHRGTMCDLWGWASGKPVGFTIHRMNEKIDDGRILVRREVPTQGVRSYIEIPLRSSRLEAESLTFVLERFAENPGWEGYPNQRAALPHTKNPSPAQIAEWRRKGLRL